MQLSFLALVALAVASVSPVVCGSPAPVPSGTSNDVPKEANSLAVDGKGSFKYSIDSYDTSVEHSPRWKSYNSNGWKGHNSNGYDYSSDDDDSDSASDSGADSDSDSDSDSDDYAYNFKSKSPSKGDEDARNIYMSHNPAPMFRSGSNPSHNKYVSGYKDSKYSGSSYKPDSKYGSKKKNPNTHKDKDTNKNKYTPHKSEKSSKDWSTVKVTYDTWYDSEATSMNGAACSSTLTTRWPTFGKTPGYPYIGGTSVVGASASMVNDACGTCWQLQWEGHSVYVTAVDSASDGWNLSKQAMDALTQNQASYRGRISAKARQVDASKCAHY